MCEKVLITDTLVRKINEMRSRNAKNLFGDNVSNEEQIPGVGEEELPTKPSSRIKKFLFCEVEEAMINNILTALLKAGPSNIVTQQSLRKQLLGDGDHHIDTDSRWKLIEHSFQEAISHGYITVETTTDILSLSSVGKEKVCTVGAVLLEMASSVDFVEQHSHQGLFQPCFVSPLTTSPADEALFFLANAQLTPS